MVVSGYTGGTISVVGVFYLVVQSSMVPNSAALLLAEPHREQAGLMPA
jgi:hypothetical protein